MENMLYFKQKLFSKYGFLAGFSALCILYGVFGLYMNEDYTQTLPQAEKAIADFAKNASAFDKIVLHKQNKDSIEIIHTDTGWMINGEHEYPADSASLQQLYQFLDGLILIDEKTSKVEHFERLGLNNDTTKIIKIFKNGTLKYHFLLGKDAPSLAVAGHKRFYFKRHDEQQSWLAESTILPAFNLNVWLNRDLKLPKADAISWIKVTPADGSEPYEFFKPNQEFLSMMLRGVPKDKKLRSGDVSIEITQNLSFLGFDAVLPLDSCTKLPQLNTGTVEWTDFDKNKWELSTFIYKEKHYAFFTTHPKESIKEWCYEIPQHHYYALTRPKTFFYQE